MNKSMNVLNSYEKVTKNLLCISISWCYIQSCFYTRMIHVLIGIGYLGKTWIFQEKPEGAQPLSSNQWNSNRGKIGARQVKKLRDDLKLSQEHFAQLLQVSLKTIIRWEQNLSIPNGANLANIQNLIKLLSEGKQRREAVLNVLAVRNEIAPAHLLRAIQAAAVIRDPEPRVDEIVQKLMGK